MNKSQQMRWSRRGADLLLQVRCAVFNGTFGSSYGQMFRIANDPSPVAIAARPPLLGRSLQPDSLTDDLGTIREVNRDISSCVLAAIISTLARRD
jgi:hypothetical protein